MSLSALDIVMRQCGGRLAQMKRDLLRDDAVLTLVVRVPGVEGGHFVVTTDDIDEVIAVLRKENGES